MKSICVFCGSNAGLNPIFLKAAQDLGHYLALKQITLVYGGASIGLMGAVADAVLEQGGKVIGVIPASLFPKELAHSNLTELHIVASMHERKQKMYDLAEGFIALPGGLGTLDELCEILTWAQLGFHHKPCGILNTQNYFDFLIRFFDQAINERFILPEHRSLYMVDETPQGLFQQFQKYHPSAFKKWIGKDQL